MKLRRLLAPLTIWFAVTLTWGIYRSLFTQPEWLEELIFKPVVFVGPVMFYLWKRERLTWERLGVRTGSKKKILLWGFGFGLFLVAESVVVSLIKKQAVNGAFFTPGSLTQATLVSLATAVSEEVLYRGFLLERVRKVVGSIFQANLLVSVLFSAAHLVMGYFVLHLSGIDMVSYLWLIFILGFADGFIYLETGSVLTPIITHSLWNLSNGFFIRG